MVSVVHSVAAQRDIEQSLQVLTEGLSPDESVRLAGVAEFAADHYGVATLGSGEGVWQHALGMALIVAGLRLDIDSRAAALLFALPAHLDDGLVVIESRFGAGVAHLVSGIWKLNQLRPLTRTSVADSEATPDEMRVQVEILRKMLLAMVEDLRVVLLRLASRTQTLRHFAVSKDDLRVAVARETLEIYSPLANRLGVWEIKWELEDLAFRFLHPETYKKIAKMLDEKRLEREQFITDAIDQVQREVSALGVKAEIYGRPKHIYSIWNKMRRKGVEFSEVYDVRALRVLVNTVPECYTVLGVIHNLWSPIPKEFDDYIAHPKNNNYRSLHTAVQCPDGRSLEVQVRTWDMHRHAELGVAAHWRYKEGGRGGEDGYEDKIAWLRQLLSWKDEVADSSDWVRHYKKAALDETVYVLTPQGRVIDLPRGSTPLDFAYRVHSDLGHRCRGAKVNGHLIPLNTVLDSGQRVEIVTAKQGGPSRDWLNPGSGYLTTKSARNKVRQWFASLALDETLTEGRAMVARELQRLGQTAANLDDLAQRLHFAKADDLFLAAGRGDLGPRQLAAAFRTDEPPPADEPEIETRPSKADHGEQGILIVGVDRLMTQLARCCKPAPPEPISGFVTRGRGVSIHREDCPTFARIAALHPERVIDTDWGAEQPGIFAVDVLIEAHDRTGLLRDISDLFAREKVNVTSVATQTKAGTAYMTFTVEVGNIAHLNRVLAMAHGIPAVVGARRR